MDTLQYEQYAYILTDGSLSLDALRRIINHDCISGWENDPDSMARKQVFIDCENGIIIPKKLYDTPGDYLYNQKLPHPLQFTKII